jgi:hypothetical protein
VRLHPGRRPHSRNQGAIRPKQTVAPSIGSYQPPERFAPITHCRASHCSIGDEGAEPERSRLRRIAESLDTLVADSDRAGAADELRLHYDSGRLTLDEFESRLAEVHRARTRGDLEHAFLQLPRSEPPASLRLRDRRWSSLALQYALVNVVCIVVWAISGAQIHNFWPKWVLLGTLIMYFRRLGRRSRRRELPPGGEHKPR